MRTLPPPETYEKEFRFMPWGSLMERALRIIEHRAPKKGSMLDLMCGPGYLLGKVNERRHDLSLDGVDNDDEFISFARSKYPDIKFTKADVLEWEPKEKYDVVACTGGLHHLSYTEQPFFLNKMADFMKDGGFCVVADPYIDDYSSELERQISASKMGCEYVKAVMEKDAPGDVIDAAIEILYNDVMGKEYKTSMKKMIPVLKKSFHSLRIVKTWPNHQSAYGDYLIIAR